MDPFTSTQKKLFHGKLLAIVKTTGKMGQITIRATSPGLKPSTLVIDAY
jgi:hypothetical protein